MYGLPTSVTVGGTEYPIRSDYRVVLDICTALSDPGLDGEEKAAVMLEIFYPDFEDMPQNHYDEAIKRCLWFINCGNDDEPTRKAPRLVDWEKDFQHIVAPVNRVAGREIRAVEYMHWWTFIGYYYEIGSDCVFAQIVRIRDKLARGKPLDKSDREWYQQNRHLVDLEKPLTAGENQVLEQWGAK